MIPGCFDSVSHNRVKNFPGHNVYGCTVTSAVHWAKDVSEIRAPKVISVDMPSSNLGRGFLLMAHGTLSKVEDLVKGTCCRDERSVTYTITPVSKGDMGYSTEMANETDRDMLLRVPAFLDAQDTGEGNTCITFISGDKQCRSCIDLPYDRDFRVKISDTTSIMFFDKCFFLMRNFRYLNSQNNDAMRGAFWQVIIL